MGNQNQNRCGLVLSFLLFPALCLEAIFIDILTPAEKMNWTQARLYCQKYHTDLMTWNIMDKLSQLEVKLAQSLKSAGVKSVWIGLLRDPDNDSVWKWINLISGEGISGDDLSQSSSWADGEQNAHCAVVQNDSKWHSEGCSSPFEFYCSGATIKHHKMALDWLNASQYCRSEGNDLAIVTEENKGTFDKPGWIGLSREAGENWTWIGNESSTYRNWAEGEPLTADCGSFHPDNGTWHSHMCSEALQFVCYDDGLVLVNEKKTWEDAMEHCRSMRSPCEDSSPCVYRHDLLSLETFSHYNYIRDRIHRATTYEVWMGLRFLGKKWWWTDGQMLEVPRMLEECPSQCERCGTLSKNNSNNWILKDCLEQRNFICKKIKVHTSGRL